jgi:hypothetical protein
MAFARIRVYPARLRLLARPSFVLDNSAMDALDRPYRDRSHSLNGVRPPHYSTPSSSSTFTPHRDNQPTATAAHDPPLVPGVLGAPSMSSNSTQGASYTVMVAGHRTGKTSFLRLLLDSSVIATTATRDQLASVAKFVQGCGGHTANTRTCSIDVEVDSDERALPKRVTLSVIDTPSLAFSDEAAAERVVEDILRHVESRFLEGLEDVRPCCFLRLQVPSEYSFVVYRSGKLAPERTMSTCMSLFASPTPL